MEYQIYGDNNIDVLFMDIQNQSNELDALGRSPSLGFPINEIRLSKSGLFVFFSLGPFD